MTVATAPDGRWFGTGHSTLSDPGKAGLEAATAAIGGRDPVVVFVFCSIGYQVPELFDAVRAQVCADTVRATEPSTRASSSSATTYSM